MLGFEPGLLTAACLRETIRLSRGLPGLGLAIAREAGMTYERRGRIPSQPCPTCQGAGEVRTERQVNITVPPGTETGTRVRLRGQGQAGRAGMPAGDLLVTFQVQSDRFFHREGLDIESLRPGDAWETGDWNPAPPEEGRALASATIKLFFVLPGPDRNKEIREAKKLWFAQHPNERPECYPGD